MALIKCLECGKEISNKAEACPHCGCPLSKMVEASPLRPESTVNNATKPEKKMKTWLLIAGAVLVVAIVAIVASSYSSKYKWNEIILNPALPKPSSNYGSLYTNDADDLYLTVRKVSFTDYETYVAGCVDKGFTYVVESGASSYTAFNSDGYELKLNYHEYNEALDISLDVRVSGTIKWPARKLVAQLPVPKSNVGSIVNNYDEHYEVYVGNTSKGEFDTYIFECESNGFNQDIQKQENSFYAKNELGYELVVEYYACDLIYINLDVPDDATETEDADESNDKEANQQTPNKTNEGTKIENNPQPVSSETASEDGDETNVKPNVYEGAVQMCQLLKDALYNPDSLQIHKVLHVELYGTDYYYLDYSAMNKMGGYTRNEYYAKFENSAIHCMVNEDDTGYPDSVEYKIMVEIFEEYPHETLDVDLIEAYLD